MKSTDLMVTIAQTSRTPSHNDERETATLAVVVSQDGLIARTDADRLHDFVAEPISSGSAPT